MFSAVQVLAQVVKDESELAAKPYYINADKMRSVNGKMETIYGQELYSSSALTGVCRGITTWADLSRSAWVAFGTHLRLVVGDGDGTQTDITPVIERGILSSAYTTSNGSAVITVTDDAHGLVADQKITFVTASSAANVLISGAYAVSSVVSSSAYQFTASTVANQSTAGVGGATIDYEYGLAPGNLNGLGGLGYGTGAYGVGAYGSPSASQALDPRTWSFAVWGQNLIPNPNWGGVYEWAPNTSASEIVNTGDFSSSGTWVYGSGWSLGAGVSSAASAARLTQAVSLVRSAWHLLRFDITVNSGTIIPLIGTSTVGVVITSSQTIKRTFFSPTSTAQSLIFDGSSAFNGRIDNVSLKVLTVANLIPGAPSSVGSVFVTAERNLVACGCTNSITGILDPMRVAWSAQENNQDWSASAANVAGSYLLSHGSRIVRGLAGNRENLIFTDTALYRMRSVPDPSVVYAFDLIGEGCGLIGPNAAVQINGAFFWVSPQGTFYQYTGGLAVPLNNPSGRDFRDNLAAVQGGKIYAANLSSQSEVWFFYPDMRDGIECSRYHIYDYADQTWCSGLYDRTSYVDAGIFPYPIATASNGGVFYQEKDFSNDGSARTTSLESSYFNIGDGDGFATVKGVRPDFDDLRGGVSITFYSKSDAQGSAERVYGPYPITSNTRRISCRIKGRQIKYKITTDAAPSFYRLGFLTFDINASGQKR